MTDRAGLDIGLELDALSSGVLDLRKIPSRRSTTTGADGNGDDHRTSLLLLLLLLLLVPAGASTLVGDGIA